MATLLPDQEGLRKASHELNALPDDWLISIDGSKRICFQKGSAGQPTYNHPTLGGLPRPWILRFCLGTEGKRVARYFNTETTKTRTDNPRHDRGLLKKEAEAQKRRGLGESSTLLKMSKNLPLSVLIREPIRDKSIRNEYHIVKVIDDGKGNLGGMNAGVFVVKKKMSPNLLRVDKRFKSDQVHWAQREIHMLHRLRHGAIAFYTAGFVTSDLRFASLYVEFCDRGSLDNLIRAFSEHRVDVPDKDKPSVPERFIWHAFGSLCDALAYLYGGRSYISFENTDYSILPDWTPILHRDLKPDNVLIRSRSTVGTKRYWYCVISDFGLACEHYNPGHAEEDKWQKSGRKHGTTIFWAPELLWNPYPKNNQERLDYPSGQRHSTKSDLWALGASIYNLADCGPSYSRGKIFHGAWSHLKVADWPSGFDWEDFLTGTMSRKRELDVSKITPNPNYSKHLRQALLKATDWDPRNRPDPIEMVKELKWRMKEARMDTHAQGPEDLLPSWATRVHDYHAREPIDPNQFAQG